MVFSSESNFPANDFVNKENNFPLPLIESKSLLIIGFIHKMFSTCVINIHFLFEVVSGS
jgi:hypothetical protein